MTLAGANSTAHGSPCAGQGGCHRASSQAMAGPGAHPPAEHECPAPQPRAEAVHPGKPGLCVWGNGQAGGGCTSTGADQLHIDCCCPGKLSVSVLLWSHALNTWPGLASRLCLAKPIPLLLQEVCRQSALSNSVRGCKWHCIMGHCLQGMKKDESDVQVRLAATVALYNALEFAQTNFDNDAERNYIMQMICEGTIASDPKVREASFECLVKIAAHYYAKLPAYMQVCSCSPTNLFGIADKHEQPLFRVDIEDSFLLLCCRT